MTRHRRIALAAAGLALVAGVAAIGVAAAGEPYRETYPRAQIDPARGVEGDIGFSDTIGYWRTPKALARHAGWVRNR